MIDRQAIFNAVVRALQSTNWEPRDKDEAGEFTGSSFKCSQTGKEYKLKNPVIITVRNGMNVTIDGSALNPADREFLNDLQQVDADMPSWASSSMVKRAYDDFAVEYSLTMPEER